MWILVIFVDQVCKDDNKINSLKLKILIKLK